MDKKVFNKIISVGHFIENNLESAFFNNKYETGFVAIEQEFINYLKSDYDSIVEKYGVEIFDLLIVNVIEYLATYGSSNILALLFINIGKENNSIDFENDNKKMKGLPIDRFCKKYSDGNYEDLGKWMLSAIEQEDIGDFYELDDFELSMDTFDTFWDNQSTKKAKITILALLNNYYNS